jgi:hypothetical protein
VQGHKGELVMLPEGEQVLIIGFGSAGSAKAQRDFESMLQSLRLSS